MLFNNNGNGDPRSFMYYKDEYYINGTEIILTDNYIDNNLFNGKKLWKYARFDHKTNYNGCNAYFFCATKLNQRYLREIGLDYNTIKNYATYFVVESYKIEDAISEITRPIKLTIEENNAISEYIEDIIDHKKTDLDYPALRVAWAVYIVVMICSLIFNQFYLVWLIASYIFVAWRKDILG